MIERKRVAVTGIGLVTPVGLDEASFRQALFSGKTGIRRIQAFNPDEYKSQNGAEVGSEALLAALAARQIKPGDRVTDMALLAAAQALEGAGLIEPTGVDAVPREIATIIGSGGGPSPTIEESYAQYAERGRRGIRPTTVVRCMINAVCSQVSMRFRLTGPNYVVVSACASSTNAIGIGFRMIRDGYATCVLCGGADSFFTPALFGAWDRLGVMSKNPDPEKASRPFDSARDGFVMGEGAGMILLEPMDQAADRGAAIRGEIIGYGESSDAHHITAPSEEGQAAAIRAAMECAGVGPDDIGFVNAHGTATKSNDECESRSVRLAMGRAADSIPVASSKSFLGHLLGAAGVVETIAVLLGLEAGRVPPNLNLDNPDPACNVRLVGNLAMDISSPIAMKNSFGFGGGNAVLVLRK